MDPKSIRAQPSFQELIKPNHRATLVTQRLGFHGHTEAKASVHNPSSSMLVYRQPTLKKQSTSHTNDPKTKTLGTNVDLFQHFSQITRITQKPNHQNPQTSRFGVFIETHGLAVTSYLQKLRKTKPPLKLHRKTRREMGLVNVFDSDNMLTGLLWRVVYTHV